MLLLTRASGSIKHQMLLLTRASGSRKHPMLLPTHASGSRKHQMLLLTHTSGSRKHQMVLFTHASGESSIISMARAMAWVMGCLCEVVPSVCHEGALRVGAKFPNVITGVEGWATANWAWG